MVAPRVTWKRVAEKIALGMGSGFEESYKPTLEIKRWNPSPMSVQVVKAVPPFKRKCHFFSHSEWYLALLSSWAGAHIREQFPLWPWPHPHPEYGRQIEVDAYLPKSVGMVDICRGTGIEHGTFVGTNIPYIWSMDLCIYLPWVLDFKKATSFISVKPLKSERYLYVDSLNRGIEKLEAERRYAAQLGIPYFIADRSLYPGHLFANLEHLAKAAVLPENHPWYSTLQKLLDKHIEILKIEPLFSIRERLIKDYKCTVDQANFIQNHILWNQYIDCNLLHPLKNSEPPKKGGWAFKQAFRSTLEGDRP
jgi:hypothetical protein